MSKRTKVYTISGFLNNESPVRIEGGIPVRAKQIGEGLIFAGVAYAVIHAIPSFIQVAHASTQSGGLAPVSTVYDQKIFPLFLDIGKPLAKTMIAFGIYKVMRGDDKGWRTVQRAGLGLVCLYLIDGAVHILQGVGEQLQMG